jgi:Secretion system C-terminal sorting domain
MNRLSKLVLCAFFFLPQAIFAQFTAELPTIIKPVAFSVSSSSYLAATSNSLAYSAENLTDGNFNSSWLSGFVQPGYGLFDKTQAGYNMLRGMAKVSTSTINERSVTAEISNATDGNLETSVAIEVDKGTNKAIFRLQSEQLRVIKLLALSYLTQKADTTNLSLEIFAITSDPARPRIKLNNVTTGLYQNRYIDLTKTENVTAIEISAAQNFKIFEIAGSNYEEFMQFDMGKPEKIDVIETKIYDPQNNIDKITLFTGNNQDSLKFSGIMAPSNDAYPRRFYAPKQGITARFFKIVMTLSRKDFAKAVCYETIFLRNRPYSGWLPIAPTCQKNTMGDFVGVNTFFNIDYLKFKEVASHVRNYHVMDFDMGAEGINPTDPNGAIQFNKIWKPAYNNWQVAFPNNVQATINYSFDGNDAWRCAQIWNSPAQAYQSAFDYGKAFAETYIGNNAGIQCVEVGNEPWRYDAPILLKVIEGMAKGIKSVSPKTIVLPPAFQASQPQVEYYSNCRNDPRDVDNGFRNFIVGKIPTIAQLDGYNLHLYSFVKDTAQFVYTYPESEQSLFRGELLDMIKYTGRTDNLYVTEFGWDANKGCTPCVTEEAQASYILRGLCLLARAGVARATVFHSVDERSAPGTIASGVFRNSGLTTQDGIKKKSFWALKAIKQELGNKRFIGIDREDGDNGHFVYKFGDCDGKVTHLVAWLAKAQSAGTQNITIQLPAGTTSACAGRLDGLVDKGYTLMPSVTASKDGTITFANSPTPTLIMLNGSCNVVSPTQEINTCERKAFYNPSTHSIQLNGEDTDLIKYEIFDILGRHFASGRTESTANISISNYKSGIYLLKTAGKSACSQQVLRFLVD